MQQDNLWATAPAPRSVGALTLYDAETNQYRMSFELHYSKKLDGKAVHFVFVTLEVDELEVVSSLVWSAHRYFWKGRSPSHVEREVKKELAKYRAVVVTSPALINGFQAVDFG